MTQHYDLNIRDKIKNAIKRNLRKSNPLQVHSIGDWTVSLIKSAHASATVSPNVEAEAAVLQALLRALSLNLCILVCIAAHPEWPSSEPQV